MKEWSKRKPFVPEVGKEYENQGYLGRKSYFKCLRSDSLKITFQNQISGWTFDANGVGIYTDGSIDWDYSTGGHFTDLD